MACTSPVTAYRSKHLSERGKRPLVFNRQAGFADLPVVIPCGNCIGCRVDRARTWALRCVHESKEHVFNSFVTLTYNDENLPSDTSIDKSVLQLFFKRLRKAGFVFRYFACGEYGDTSNRPHYHIIFFGIDFHEDRKIYKRGTSGVLYTSKALNQAWPFGHAIIANFSYQTASYTARYVIKKRTGEDAHEHANYQRLDLETAEIFYVNPEFVLMSRRPGLGASWYEKYKKDVFPSDFLVHQDKKFSVPKFYHSKLENQNSKAFVEVRKKRRKALQETIHLRSPYHLEAKSIILRQKESQQKRTI